MPKLDSYQPSPDYMVVRRLKQANEKDIGDGKRLVTAVNQGPPMNEGMVVRCAEYTSDFKKLASYYANQHVLFSNHAGTPINIDGEELLQLHHNEVLGMFVKSETSTQAELPGLT